MEAWFAADGPASAIGLASLADWLRREEDLRGRVRLDSRPPESDQMGSLADTLAVAVGGGGALSVLANSLSVWLRQPRRSAVRIVMVKPDGTNIEITGTTLRTAAEIETLVHECLHADQGS